MQPYKAKDQTLTVLNVPSPTSTGVLPDKLSIWFENDEDERTRTSDLLHVKETFYQLNYALAEKLEKSHTPLRTNACCYQTCMRREPLSHTPFIIP